MPGRAKCGPELRLLIRRPRPEVVGKAYRKPDDATPTLLVPGASCVHDPACSASQTGGQSGHEPEGQRADHKIEDINRIRRNPKKQWTRIVRAIVLLEHIGTPEAVAILREMATGHPDAQPTEAARDSLERFGKSGRVR